MSDQEPTPSSSANDSSANQNSPKDDTTNDSPNTNLTPNPSTIQPLISTTHNGNTLLTPNGGNTSIPTLGVELIPPRGYSTHRPYTSPPPPVNSLAKPTKLTDEPATPISPDPPNVSSAADSKTKQAASWVGGNAGRPRKGSGIDQSAFSVVSTKKGGN